MCLSMWGFSGRSFAVDCKSGQPEKGDIKKLSQTDWKRRDPPNKIKKMKKQMTKYDLLLTLTPLSSSPSLISVIFKDEIPELIL